MRSLLRPPRQTQNDTPKGGKRRQFKDFRFADRRAQYHPNARPSTLLVPIERIPEADSGAPVKPGRQPELPQDRFDLDRCDGVQPDLEHAQTERDDHSEGDGLSMKIA